ncbi:MAG: hypothetical protein JKY54_03995 [Flavobacteriales bacterium]|nr:hypothetical protein [Flavobacteriales bacterium]
MVRIKSKRGSNFKVQIDELETMMEGLIVGHEQELFERFKSIPEPEIIK